MDVLLLVFTVVGVAVLGLVVGGVWAIYAAGQDR